MHRVGNALLPSLQQEAQSAVMLHELLSLGYLMTEAP